LVKQNKLTYLIRSNAASLSPIFCVLQKQIHRIGQTSKTFIHRYIIKDTIEVKIDRLRGERQIHEGEAEETHDKESTILRAGGLDGGFNENELQELLEYS